MKRAACSPSGNASPSSEVANPVMISMFIWDIAVAAAPLACPESELSSSK